MTDPNSTGSGDLVLLLVRSGGDFVEGEEVGGAAQAMEAGGLVRVGDVEGALKEALTAGKLERLRKAYKVTEGEGEGGVEEAVITRMATIDC